jgi:hypothetical protein
MSLGLLLFIASASKLLSFIVTVGSSTFVGGVLIFYNAPLYVKSISSNHFEKIFSSTKTIVYGIPSLSHVQSVNF